jgi:hypothetical protein
VTAGDPAGPAPSDRHPGRGGRPPHRVLRLDAALDQRAAEDQPESWGDRESDAARTQEYQANRPPHHGG